MPTFFFDVYDGRSVVCDETGAEMADVHEAAEEAAALLPDFARDAGLAGHAQDFAACVRDEAGNVVYRAILVFRGKLTSTRFNTHVVPVARDEFNLRVSETAIEDARDLERRVSENVRKLMTTIECSRSLRETSLRLCEASRRLRDPRRSGGR